ncbi:MAG: alpha/beta hydrolase, partial [Pseudomonadota bacterium]|nr:alpha/beta hydrolase [Pseudomonadota bacterium]
MKAAIVLLALVLVAGAGLWLAVRNNGPAVLDALDRVTGGARGVELVAKARYGTHPAQKLRIYRPDGYDDSQPLPVLLFVHGGSWNWGDPDDYNFIARAFAPAG